MACNSVTLQSIDARCHRSIGGLKRILIALRDDVVQPTADASTGEISTVSLKQGKKFEEWLFRPNTASYTSTLSSDQAIGNQAVTTEVSLQFTKAEATKRLAIQSAINAAAVVILEDMYGQHIYLGYDDEVYVTAATMVSGTAATDLNGFTLTFTDVAQELPHFIAAGFDVDTLLTAASAS